jgi:hypothetical protein
MEVKGRRRKQLLDDLKKTKCYWKLKEETIKSHSVENSFWKKLWTCRKRDCVISELKIN